MIGWLEMELTAKVLQIHYGLLAYHAETQQLEPLHGL